MVARFSPCRPSGPPRLLSVPNWASAYNGVPFVDKGRDPAGWDCWGLLRWIYGEHFGILLASYTDRYASADAAAEIAAVMVGEMACWRELRAPLQGGERVRLGDGILMRKGRHNTHVGVALDRRRMLHVDVGIDTEIEDFDGLLWGRRVAGIYRHVVLDHA